MPKCPRNGNAKWNGVGLDLDLDVDVDVDGDVGGCSGVLRNDKPRFGPTPNCELASWPFSRRAWTTLSILVIVYRSTKTGLNFPKNVVISMAYKFDDGFVLV